MKIVIGGQMGKEEIKELAEGIVGDKGLVVIEDDIAAAMEIKQGTAELYLGACMTGGGGALAMAIAMRYSVTVSIPALIIGIFS